MKKKLLLINPCNRERLGIAGNPAARFQPLGLGIVAALTPDNWDVAIIDENFSPCTFPEADLVGITTLTPMVNRAYQIAEAYRGKGIPTVLGGIHASCLPDEAQQYADAVVVGEAETVWGEVLNDFEKQSLRKVYRGERTALKHVPWPRRDLFREHYRVASVQTSRGCPMDCEFCAVTAFHGRDLRQRPVRDVLDEIEHIPQRYLFITDDDIMGLGTKRRERALEFFRGMISRGIRKRWMCHAAMNFGEDDEVLETAARSGLGMVLIGVESEKRESLRDINKNVNLARVDRYADIFRNFNRHGIAVMGTFIFGMDSDTPDDLADRFSYIRTSPVNVPAYTVLTPLPGTRLFETMRRQLRLVRTDFPADWNRYHFSELVFTPARMTAGEFKTVIDREVRGLYTNGFLLKKCVQTLMATRSPGIALITWQLNRTHRQVALLEQGGHAGVGSGQPTAV